MRKKKRKRKPISEATRQKMRDVYKARMEAKKPEPEIKKKNTTDDFDSTIDVRQQIADFLGLSR